MKRRRVFLLTLAAATLGIAGTLLYSWFPRRIVRRFSAVGVSRVVLRASLADSVQISYLPHASEISVSGAPSGGAGGYHSNLLTWRETPARRWGLDFTAERFGSVLVISTKNEIAFMHHHYYLNDLTLRIPEGTLVTRIPRELSGDGAPDLRAP